MSNVKKFVRFCESNIVMVTGIPLIVGIHWFWYKLQQNPALVKDEERKDLPIIIGWRKLHNYIRDEVASFNTSDEKTAAEKSN